MISLRTDKRLFRNSRLQSYKILPEKQRIWLKKTKSNDMDVQTKNCLACFGCLFLSDNMRESSLTPNPSPMGEGNKY